MRKELKIVLDNVDTTYKELVEISNGIVNPYVEEVDQLVFKIKSNLEKLSLDDMRNYMLQLSLIAYSLGEVKEKSNLKFACAEALKDEIIATKFNSVSGNIKERENSAILESNYEILSEAIYSEVYSLFKIKLDSIYKIVDALKNILISRASEAKLIQNQSAGENV